MISRALASGLLAAPPLAVLGVSLFNMLRWPRGRPDGRIGERVSVLIPARDEERTIERCVRGVLGGTRSPDEVLVYDDGSTDATPNILARLAEDPRVRVIPGMPLPPGWVGKPHACHRLAEAATGDVLVFVDADTALDASGLARIGSVLEDYRADVVTAGIRQVTGTAAERLVIPLLHLSYLAWLPIPLVWRTRDPRLLIANGQLVAVRRDTYDAVGGWAAVRAEVVDDMAFCRLVKQAGRRVVFADGHRMATSRMYHGGGELWDGFSKNLYEGIGGRPVALALVLALHGWIFVAPYAALGAAAMGVRVLLLPAAIGVGANVAMRGAMAVRYRQPWEGVVLHPLAVAALMGIALNSFRWARRGAIRWRGRVYASRSLRAVPPASAS